jgi:flavin-dependent dehydrogenase
MTDVLIAGGSVAGASLAILLGRAGLGVMLFEKASFPREKACGEGLMPGGVAALNRLGVDAAAHGAPFRGVHYCCGGLLAAGEFPPCHGRPAFGLGLRRLALDALLLEAARATPGVVVRDATRVEAPIIERGRVAGLRILETGQDKTDTEGSETQRTQREDMGMHRAALVVAADGVHSPLRRALGLDVAPRRRRCGVRAHFRLARGVVMPEWVDVFVRAGHEMYVTPLARGELLVAALAEEGALQGDARGMFAAWCAAEPALRDLLEGAEQLTPLRGAAPLAGRARAGWIPGCVLLGDAAGFLDPVTGGGMTQALESAELLASFIVARGLRRCDAWLEEFDRARRALLRDYERVTAALLWLSERPALARAAIAALRRAPRVFSHLIGVSAGTRRLLPVPRRLRVKLGPPQPAAEMAAAGRSAGKAC